MVSGGIFWGCPVIHRWQECRMPTLNAAMFMSVVSALSIGVGQVGEPSLLV